MFTSEQKQWIKHLSDMETVRIVPFDSTAKEKFERVRKRIREVIGDDFPIEHHGATSLKISGQDEIDIYIPVSPGEFDLLVDSLKKLFGEPRSLYPLNRARFVTEEGGKHVDIFPINCEHEGWKNLVRFESYLRSHPEILKQYQTLKEESGGLSVRDYYRKKIEFINNIVSPV